MNMSVFRAKNVLTNYLKDIKPSKNTRYFCVSVAQKDVIEIPSSDLHNYQQEGYLFKVYTDGHIEAV